MIYMVPVVFAIPFHVYIPGNFSYRMLIWCVGWLAATQLNASCWQLSVNTWNAIMRNTHVVCSVIDIIHSMRIIHPAFSFKDVKHFHVECWVAPHICVTVISQVEFQLHLLYSLNVISYLVIRSLQYHSAALSLLTSYNILLWCIYSLQFYIILQCPIVWNCSGCYTTICIIFHFVLKLSIHMDKMYFIIMTDWEMTIILKWFQYRPSCSFSWRE